MRGRRRTAVLALAVGLLLLGLPAGASQAQAAPGLRLRVGPAGSGWKPVVEAEALLEDAALREALGAGLPLRFRFRIELWRKGLFDRLVESEQQFFALAQDPLNGVYVLDTGRTERSYADLAAAQQGVAALLRPSLSGSGRGRFYYLATLEVETLSLSDLAELRRWLRGEVGPAVQGQAPVGRAVERGVRRALVRLIGLPTRRYEARSSTFFLR